MRARICQIRSIELHRRTDIYQIKEEESYISNTAGGYAILIQSNEIFKECLFIDLYDIGISIVSIQDLKLSYFLLS